MSGVLGGLFGGGASLAGITGLVTQLVGTAQGATGGGLASLVEQFETSGLGMQVKSWIGHGENLPVHPDQLAAAVPPEQIESWSRSTGLPPDQLLRALAHVLPHAVNAATPAGQLPQAGAEPVPGAGVPDATPDFAGLVGRLFGR